MRSQHTTFQHMEVSHWFSHCVSSTKEREGEHGGVYGQQYKFPTHSTHILLILYCTYYFFILYIHTTSYLLSPVYLYGAKPLTMIAHQLDNNGTCSTCKAVAKEVDIVACLDCKSMFHADCNNVRPFCNNRSFIDTHVRMSRSSTNNFSFMCDRCLTRREHNEACSLKEQLTIVVESLASLTKEFQEFKSSHETTTRPHCCRSDCSDDDKNENKKEDDKNENKNENNNEDENVNNKNENNDGETRNSSPWNDNERTKAMRNRMKKYTLCIKSNDGASIDAEKVKNIITTNGIKVNKASVNKKNNDLYVELPSDEQREKLIPILTEEVIPGNEVVNIKEKFPTISIRGVEDYVSGRSNKDGKGAK